MIDQILTFALIAMNILISLLFLKCFFPKTKFVAKDVCLICLLIIECIVVSVTFHSIVILKLVLNLVSEVVVTILLFNVSWKRSLVYNLLFFGICGSLWKLYVI